MVFHDYECTECGHRQIDVPSTTSTQIQRILPCTECDGTARMIFVTSNFIHNSHSGMYGKFHAGFGEVVESYSHKRELLKKYNVTESADPVGGSRCHIGSDVTNAAPRNTEPAGFGTTPDEAVAAAEKAYNEEK